MEGIFNMYYIIIEINNFIVDINNARYGYQ